MESGFRQDRQLNLKYSHIPGDIKIVKLLEELKKLTNHKFTVDANEPYFDRYFIACADCTVLSLMDVICLLRPNRQWHILGKGKYNFEETVDGALSVFGTNGDPMKERRFAILGDILSEIQRSFTLSSQIFDQGISGSQIPVQLRGKLRDLIVNERSAQTLPGGHAFSSFDSDQSANFTLSAKKEDVNGLEVIKFSIGSPGRFGYTMSYSDQSKSVESKNRIAPNYYSRYQYPLLDRRNQKIEANQILGKDKIDLDISNKTIMDIVSYLHDNYKINFLCDSKDDFRQRKSFQTRNSTLSDTLDQLVQVFPGIGWEYRKTGIFLIRSPKNPLAKR